jgi:hypothetical protein
MKHSILLLLLTALFLQPSFAQELGEDVDDLKLVELSPTTVRLSWKPIEIGNCERAVYSVFRGNSEDFTPSLTNRIATRISKNAYVVTEPTSKDYYYHVKALTMPTQCSTGSGREQTSTERASPRSMQREAPTAKSQRPVAPNEYRVVKLEVRDRDVATRLYPEDTPACWITVRNDHRTILAEHVSSGVVCDISVGDTVEIYSGDKQYLVKTGHPEEADPSTCSPKYLYFIQSDEER